MALFEIAKNGNLLKKIFREIDLFVFTSFFAFVAQAVWLPKIALFSNFSTLCNTLLTSARPNGLFFSGDVRFQPGPAAAATHNVLKM